MEISHQDRQRIFALQGADDHGLFTVPKSPQIAAWAFFNTLIVSFSTSTSGQGAGTMQRRGNAQRAVGGRGREAEPSGPVRG